MPFREKTAWAMMLILTVAGAYYTNLVLTASQALGAPAPPIVPFVVAYIVVIVLAAIVIMIPLAIATPEEANAPADERERGLQHKAGDYAGYVLGASIIAALFNFIVTQDGNLMFHIVFAGLMISQICEYGFQIWFYRRGA